jgi:two-component system CheB/CheR fusion protein
LSRSPIFVWDFDGGVIQWNRGSEELYGYLRDEAIGQRKELLLRPTVPGSTFAALRDSLAEHGTWAGELLHRTKDGRELIVESQIELIQMGGRRLVLESTRDVTDRKRWETRQKLLLAELTHRMKNTLTVVQSMARQTLRTTGSGKEFVQRFEGRLSALASAHSLLVDSQWQGAELGALARHQLQAHLGGDLRFRFEGEPVTLPADLATPFGLILHELATNAVKYGSLSSEKGSVVLTWRLETQDDQRRLIVVWREIDGPPVKKPESNGFGSVLIGKSLPEASVSHEFLSEGVICTIELPLPELDRDGATA